MKICIVSSAFALHDTCILTFAASATTNTGIGVLHTGFKPATPSPADVRGFDYCTKIGLSLLVACDTSISYTIRLHLFHTQEAKFMYVLIIITHRMKELTTFPGFPITPSVFVKPIGASKPSSPSGNILTISSGCTPRAIGVGAFVIFA